MTNQLVEGVQRAVFGPVTQDQIDGWLHDLVRIRLSSAVREVVFRAGRLAAVYGLRLADGVGVVVKVHREGTNVAHLAAASAAQRTLADAGFPCPRPIGDVVRHRSHVAAVESLLDRGARGDAHRTDISSAMAARLAEQVDLLRSVPTGELASGRPAWARYEAGPWPTPHDPIFDFTTTPARYAWLDRLAQSATDRLGPPEAPDVIAHADWACQNLRFDGATVVAAFDWDSLTAHDEPVLVGVSAGAYTEGSVGGAEAPTPDEVGTFLTLYEEHRGTSFTGRERTRASAAATWVMAYNARCAVAFLRADQPVPTGSPLHLLDTYRDAYLTAW